MRYWNCLAFDKCQLWGNVDDNEGPDHPIEERTCHSTTNSSDWQDICGMKVAHPTLLHSLSWLTVCYRSQLWHESLLLRILYNRPYPLTSWVVPFSSFLPHPIPSRPYVLSTSFQFHFTHDKQTIVFPEHSGWPPSRMEGMECHLHVILSLIFKPFCLISFKPLGFLGSCVSVIVGGWCLDSGGVVWCICFTMSKLNVLFTEIATYVFISPTRCTPPIANGDVSFGAVNHESIYFHDSVSTRCNNVHRCPSSSLFPAIDRGPKGKLTYHGWPHTRIRVDSKQESSKEVVIQELKKNPVVAD